jgi:hypothetical protein
MTIPCLKCYFCKAYLIIDDSIFCGKHEIPIYHNFKESILERVIFETKIKNKKYEAIVYVDVNRFVVNEIRWKWGGEASDNVVRMNTIPKFTPENLQDKMKTWTVFS